MLNIVCLIKPSPSTFYFVNKIHAEHGVSKLVVEDTPFKKKISNVVKQRGIKALPQAIIKKLNQDSKATAHYNKIYGDQWKAIDSSIEVIKVENINDPELVKELDQLKPDLILDHGTSIVREQVLDTAPLALNLHWGLSPYYRGTACTDWALINWDPYNIGVTIHKLAKKIDGGDILAQERVSVSPDDTVATINSNLTLLGTDLFVDIIAALKNGQDLKFEEQDFAQGYLTRNKQFGSHLAKQVKLIESQGQIASMLKTPARKEKMPIVKFKSHIIAE